MSKVDENRPKRKKTGGRKKGTPNKNTSVLKDAIIQAATEVGGKEGLVGYCKLLAQEEPRAFASLMGRVLPMQVNGSGITITLAKEADGL